MPERRYRGALPLWAIVILLIGCADADSQHSPRAQEKEERPAANAPGIPAKPDAQFAAYWYQGKAEVTRFALDQARYGEMRKGDAVMIFVTEDFLANEQVKLESDPAGRAYVPVLKLNLTKKFNTGIYPYSMMASVFTPIDTRSHGHSLKVTTSSQEWCGHTFTQFNLRDESYKVQLRSYFQKEGDREFSLDAVLLEDEVWSRIRLAPESLPTGRVRIIPGTFAQRLRHTEFTVTDATATLAPVNESPAQMRYTIMYPNSDRTLAIDFEKSFPHRILAWSETYRDGSGPNAKVLTTHAVRTNELIVDYWTKHDNDDDDLRRQLGLP